MRRRSICRLYWLPFTKLVLVVHVAASVAPEARLDFATYLDILRDANGFWATEGRQFLTVVVGAPADFA
jgi:hypothetical protein